MLLSRLESSRFVVLSSSFGPCSVLILVSDAFEDGADRREGLLSGFGVESYLCCKVMVDLLCES
jgi:hypothetical protein